MTLSPSLWDTIKSPLSNNMKQLHQMVLEKPSQARHEKRDRHMERGRERRDRKRKRAK